MRWIKTPSAFDSLPLGNRWYIISNAVLGPSWRDMILKAKHTPCGQNIAKIPGVRPAKHQPVNITSFQRTECVHTGVLDGVLRTWYFIPLSVSRSHLSICLVLTRTTAQGDAWTVCQMSFVILHVILRSILSICLRRLAPGAG